jgi:hypothetical protein
MRPRITHEASLSASHGGKVRRASFFLKKKLLAARTHNSSKTLQEKEVFIRRKQFLGLGLA